MTGFYPNSRFTSVKNVHVRKIYKLERQKDITFITAMDFRCKVRAILTKNERIIENDTDL